MVDGDPPVPVEPHPRLLEPETRGVRRTPGGEQDRVRGHDSAGRERDVQPTVDTPDPVRVGAEDDSDTAARELLGHESGQLAVEGGQQPVGRADQRHRDTESGEGAGELDAYRAAADDDDVLRGGADRVDPIGVVDVGIVERVARRVSRA